MRKKLEKGERVKGEKMLERSKEKERQGDSK